MQQDLELPRELHIIQSALTFYLCLRTDPLSRGEGGPLAPSGACNYMC